MLGRVTLLWTSIPSRGSRNTSSRFIFLKLDISAGVIGHLARMQTFSVSCSVLQLAVAYFNVIAYYFIPIVPLYFLLASEEVSSPPMTTRSRTYNTRTNSSKQPVVTSKKYSTLYHLQLLYKTEAQAIQVLIKLNFFCRSRLIVYPSPPQAGGITVTTEDIACLDSGEFLNDVIIDFYLK